MGSIVINKIHLSVMFIVLLITIVGYGKAYRDKMELSSTVSALYTELAEKKAKHLESEKNLLLQINKQNYIQQKLSKEIAELKNAVDVSVEKNEADVDKAINSIMWRVNKDIIKPYTFSVTKNNNDNSTTVTGEINSSVLIENIYKVYKGDI